MLTERFLLCLLLGVGLFEWSDGTLTTATTITNGTVQGFQCGTAICFLGIPFAAPPVGSNRFQNPKPFPAAWRGSINATKFPPECVQLSLKMQMKGSEDCLFLNVITPPFRPNVKEWPVMVFIHGGGYEIGATLDYNYPGITENVVSRGVIVVSIQYRLNVFGFLTTGEGSIPANLGMLDQIQALRWVQAEIANFGGDPQRVTIFGQSAGGASVSLLTYSPLAREEENLLYVVDREFHIINRPAAAALKYLGVLLEFVSNSIADQCANVSCAVNVANNSK